MKTLSILAASLMALGAGGASFAGDENIVTKDLDFTGFDRIEIAGVYDIDIRVGPDFSIELSGPDYEMARIEASVKNGVLQLDQRKRKRGDKRRGWREKREGVDAAITLPSLLSFDLSGVVDGTISGVDSENFDLDISGVGDVKLDGECGELDANVSGVGDLDAEGLECRVVKVKVSGVGDASVFAHDEVDARVSGVGDIDVYGSPEKVSKDGGMFADITVH